MIISDIRTSKEIMAIQYTAQDAPLKTIIMCISSDMEALTE